MTRTEKRRQAFTSLLQGGMTEILSDRCFRSDGPFVWLRQWGWKVDLIELTIKFHLVINLYVYLPVEEAPELMEDGIVDVAMTSLGNLRGSRGAIPFPSAWSSINQGVERLLRDLQRGIGWFDQFDSPNHCLQFLRSAPNTRGITPLPGSPGYVACKSYLSSLPDDLDCSACTINQFKRIPSQGFRRLFLRPADQRPTQQ